MRSVIVLALAVFVASLGVASAAPAGRVTILCSPNPPWCDAVKAEFPKATGIAPRS